MAESSSQLALAIPPFENKSGEETAWLSSGISDTLIAKFSELDGLTLVEREKIESVIEATPKKDDEKVRKMLGADYLVLGSFVFAGDLIRINARIVTSSDSEILSDSSISVTGKRDELFELQTELGREIAKRCSIKIPESRLAYRDGETHEAYRLYNLGKNAFRKGKGAKYADDQLNFSHPQVDEHLGHLEKAIDLLQKAQTLNEIYFVEAHYLEGQSRKAVIRAHENEKKKEEVQKAYLKKFRADAAQAAPAFYNLGMAQQSVGNFSEAVESFDRFLKWHDANARPLQWQVDSANEHRLIKTEESPYFFLHGKREREQGNFGRGRFGVSWRPWVITGEHLVMFRWGHLEKRILATGELIWKHKLGSIQSQYGNKSRIQYPNILISRANKVFWCSMEKIYVLDFTTGEVLHDIKTDLPNKTEGAFYVYDRENLMLLSYANGSGSGRKSETIAWNIDDGLKAWTQPIAYSPVNAYHNGKYYTANSEGQLLEVDIKTGESQKLSSFEQPIYQIWPGNDHLLIRCSDKPRRHYQDEYFKWNHQSRKISKDSRNLFFNPFYDQSNQTIQEKEIPFMSGDSPHYTLLPGTHFYPDNPLLIIDNEKSFSFNVKESIPAFRMMGQKLFVWNLDRSISGYSVNNKELLWHKAILNSSSLIDLKGKYVVSMGKGKTLSIFNNIVSPYTKWYLDAWERKAACMKVLNRLDEALASLNEAYTNANNDAFINRALGQLHMDLGNMNEALQHYALVMKNSTPSSEEYKEARATMDRTIGLIRHIPVRPVNTAFIDKDVVYSSRAFQGLRRYSMEKDTVEVEIPEFSDFWKVYDGTLNYKTEDHKFTKKNPVDGSETVIFHDPRIQAEMENRNGKKNTLRWQFQKFEDLMIYMVVENETRKVVALDLKAGQIRWEKEVKGMVSVSTKEVLMLALFDSDYAKKCRIMRIDPANGHTMWERVIEMSSYNIGGKIDDVTMCLAEMLGDDLIVTILFRRPTTLPMVHEPKWPYYVLDPENGDVRKVVHGQEVVFHGRANDKDLVIFEATWNYEHPLGNDFIMRHHWMKPETTHIVEADFMEKHPRLLSEFPPLAHLKDEFDLSKHVNALNEIIDDDAKRKAFLNNTLPLFKARYKSIGNEPLQNTLRHRIEEGMKDEEVEKFVARQLMTFWRRRENFAMIRPFRRPNGARFMDINQIVKPRPEAKVVIGHYRGVLMGADIARDNQNLTNWKAMPLLNGYRPYYHDIKFLNYNEETTLVHAISGLSIYDTQKLIRYMEENISYEEGCFSVDTPSDNLSLAVDNNPSTSAQLKGERRKVIGIDHGEKISSKGVNLRVPKGYGKHFINGVVLSSSHSETGGYEVIAAIPSALEEEKMVHIPFSESVTARYFKVVIPSKEDVSVSEISFE